MDAFGEEILMLNHFLRGNFTPPMPDALYSRHVFNIDLLWLKNAPKWIPYDALRDQLKNIFAQHYRPKMDTVYNRHVLGTEPCFS